MLLMPYFPTSLSTTYADESDDKQRFVLAFVSIPTLSIRAAHQKSGADHISNDWGDYFERVKRWRSQLKDRHNIPVKKEIKGSKLAKGRNHYDGGSGPIYGRRAVAAYMDALDLLNFLPDASIFSVYAVRDYNMYGHRKLTASLYAALQRIERQNKVEQRRSLLIFDEGHGEYRTLYRRACVHLPTGSSQGLWASGARSKNIPLSTTIKDANFKDSKTSHFIQIADLVAYATLLKARLEADALTEKEANLGLGNIHDAIPRRILNTRVVTGGSDGIVRLK